MTQARDRYTPHCFALNLNAVLPRPSLGHSMVSALLRKNDRFADITTVYLPFVPGPMWVCVPIEYE